MYEEQMSHVERLVESQQKRLAYRATDAFVVFLTPPGEHDSRLLQQDKDSWCHLIKSSSEKQDQKLNDELEEILN